jgi:Baseplate J-like protein
MSQTASERGRLIPPDLDDRSWQDLVDEARALIPKYAPQWTDHGPGDPGIALIELFAWLVEGLIYKLNRVPEKHYLAFLNLLGITRDPPTPARVLLTFTPRPGTASVTVPKGTQASTHPTEVDRPILFESDTDVALMPGRVAAAVRVDQTTTALTYTDMTGAITGTAPPGGTIQVPAGTTTQVCLGFTEPTEHRFDLHLELDDPLRPGEQPTVQWVHASAALRPDAWPQVPDVADPTRGLRRTGAASLKVPAGAWAVQAPRDWTGVIPAPGTNPLTQAWRWIGIRVSNGSNATASFRVRLAAVNTVAATAALSIRVPEPLGTSDGRPFQVHALANVPVFKRPASDTPYDHLSILVDGVPWTLEEELPPGPGQRFRLDPVSGEIRFGNHDPQTGTGRGSVPPAGKPITAGSYRYVDSGAAGNVGSGLVDTVHTPVDGVVEVTNPLAAEGGSDEEPVEATKRRAPDLLRNRNRAVTAEDYEVLAREATTDVAIVRCLTPRVLDADVDSERKQGDPWTYGGLIRAPGNVNLVIVPDAGLATRRPEPSIGLIHEVLADLDRRRDLATHLHVTGPRYLPVKPVVDARVWQRAIDQGRIRNANEVYAQVRASAERFLHPLRGGPDGRGWQVGQSVFASDVYAAIRPPVEHGYIASLDLVALVPPYHDPPYGPGGAWSKDERPSPLNIPLPSAPAPVVLVADYELVCFGDIDLQPKPTE